MKLRPDVLTHPNIPKPLHGISPRNILGIVQWDDIREEVINRQHGECLACGAKERIEVHEVYEINYTIGEIKFTEYVGLCSSCHSFIHHGLLRSNYLIGKITIDLYESTMMHGFSILANAGLEPNVMAKLEWTYHTSSLSDSDIYLTLSTTQKKMLEDMKTKIDWSSWHLLFEGNKYYSKFKNRNEWRKHYYRRNK